MKPQNLHAQEDRLLDFVYGELPPLEARAVESHLEGCARCSELLAGIRGVRHTMAQLPMEPAPDAGLESLLAYAEQAARNAAAGPAPKPTWWRRWLMPVAGVAAVCLFGIVSIQVSKSVDLSPELAKQSAPAREEAVTSKSERTPVSAPSAVASSTPAPAQVAVPATPAAGPPPAPPPPPMDAQYAAEDAAKQGEAAAQPTAGMTPPPPAPAAKLDQSFMAKEAARKPAYVSGSKAKAARSDWSNSGAGAAGFERAKDADDALLGAADEKAFADKNKKQESYDHERRDAMTQMGPLKKSRPTSVGSTRGYVLPEPTPASGAALPAEEARPSEPEMVAQAQVQQEATASEGLQLNRGRAGGTAPGKAPVGDESVGDDLDALSSTKASTSRREQYAAMNAAPPPTTAAAPMAPAPRAEAKGKSEEASPAELSSMAEAALRSGNRVREAQYLRLALEAGATGSLRLGLLNRLCDAEFAIGRRKAAIDACNLVLEEGPRSGAAQVARKRLSNASSDESDGARAGASSKAAKAAEMEAPSAPAATPAASTPAQGH